MIEVELPDGTIAEFPDSMQPDQIKAVLRKQYQPQAATNPAEYSPTGSFGQNALAGVGKAFVDLGRGVKDVAGDAIEGIGFDRPEFAKENDAAVLESRRLDAPLMATGGGLLGNIAGNVIAAAPTVAIPGANTVAGAGLLGAAMGASQATTEDESRLNNTLLAAAGGAGGQKIASSIGAAMRAAPGKEAAKAVQNATRDDVVQTAMDAGYKLPPVSVNPGSKAAQVAESVSGKIMTQQTASQANQVVTNNLAKRAVGLADADELTASALSSIRKKAGSVYDEVGKARDFFDADDVFRSDLDGALSDYKTLIKEFPDMANKGLEDLSETLGRDQFSGANVLRLVRKLRNDAKSNYKAFGDPDKLELARAQSKAAKAIEDMIERNLDGSDLMSKFKQARATIAKSHSIESALDEAGNVDAHKIAKMVEKGEPLSGEMRTIGRTASAFKDATRVPKGSVNQITLPTAAAAAFGMGSGNVPLAMLAMARPAVRAGILSGPGQRLLASPKYSSKAFQGLLGAGLDTEIGGLLSRTAGPASIGAFQ